MSLVRDDMLSSRGLDGDVVDEERADGELAEIGIMDVKPPDCDKAKPRGGGEACDLDDDSEGSGFLDRGWSLLICCCITSRRSSSLSSSRSK